MYVYRKLVPAEIGLLHDHLLRLTPEDRHCRFAGFVSEERIAEYCSRVDWFRTIVIGSFIDGTLRGVAELRLDDPRVGWRAELAVTVELEWQSRGIGTELLRRAITVCRNRAIRSIYMICLVANRRMQRIARRFDGDLIIADGEAEAKVALPFPDQFTLAREFLEDGAAWMMACIDLPTRGAAATTSN
jgi:RimJ/RimL family protein N-acetyltransferase